MTQTQSRADSKSGKLAPYDVADHLRSPEEMAAYLDAWFEESPDDVTGIERAVGYSASQRYDTGREGCWLEPRELISRFEPRGQSEPFHNSESTCGCGS